MINNHYLTDQKTISDESNNYLFCVGEKLASKIGDNGICNFEEYLGNPYNNIISNQYYNKLNRYRN